MSFTKVFCSVLALGLLGVALGQQGGYGGDGENCWDKKDEKGCKAVMMTKNKEKIAQCVWDPKSENDKCSDFYSDCQQYSKAEQKGKCNAQKDTRFKTPQQACVFISSSMEQCSPYNACQNKPKTQCSGPCVWDTTDKDEEYQYCKYKDESVTERAADAKECYNQYTQKDCGTGTSPQKDCAWTKTVQNYCQEYSHCTAYKDADKCDADEECYMASMGAGGSAGGAGGGNAGEGGGEKQCMPGNGDDMNGGMGSGGGMAQCYANQDEKECDANGKNDDGKKICEWGVEQNNFGGSGMGGGSGGANGGGDAGMGGSAQGPSGYCDILSTCTKLTKDKCGKADKCTWEESAAMGTGEGTCFDSEQVSDSPCYSIRKDADCKKNAKCDWKEPTEGPPGGGDAGMGGDGKMCINYDYCTESKTSTACAEDKSCLWQQDFTSMDAGNTAMKCMMSTGQDGMGMGGFEDCSTQKNTSACGAFTDEFAGGGYGSDDAAAGGGGGDGDDENPSCMWNVFKDSYCQTYDPCSVFKDKAVCKSKKCQWSGDNMEGGNAANMGGGGMSSGGIGADAFCLTPTQNGADTGCYNANDEGGCIKINKAKGKKLCEWHTSVSEVCQNWELCEGRPETRVEAGCKAKKGCVWLPDDARCMALADTTVTSTTVTSTTTTQTTTFHCDDDSFQMCTTGRQCKRKTWFCDGQPDCDDGSDEVGCTTTEAPPTTTTTETTVTETTLTDSTTSTVTETTTTATTTTSTTTTTTTTTTTIPKCVLDDKCSSLKRFLEAKTGKMFFSTTIECRMCADPSKTEAELCAEKRTSGCPKVAVSTLSPELKSSGKYGVSTYYFKNAATRRLRREATAEQIRQAFEDYLGNQGDVRKTSIVEIAVDVGAKTIVVYTELNSGLAATLAKNHDRPKILAGKTSLTCYNDEVWVAKGGEFVKKSDVSKAPRPASGRIETGTDTDDDVVVEQAAEKAKKEAAGELGAAKSALANLEAGLAKETDEVKKDALKLKIQNAKATVVKAQSKADKAEKAAQSASQERQDKENTPKDSEKKDEEDKDDTMTGIIIIAVVVVVIGIFGVIIIVMVLRSKKEGAHKAAHQTYANPTYENKGQAQANQQRAPANQQQQQQRAAPRTLQLQEDDADA